MQGHGRRQQLFESGHWVYIVGRSMLSICRVYRQRAYDIEVAPGKLVPVVRASDSGSSIGIKFHHAHVSA